MTVSAPSSRERDRPSLASRFAGSLASQGRILPGQRLVVAVSGGVDSLTLLHLLRFAPGRPIVQLVAAHFDHRMREESGEEALWVRGICRSWDLPVRVGEAAAIPGSEEEAREARYRFLLDVLARDDGDFLLTGHHGDDQAETVLFRVLRGTGLRGLAGIPSFRSPQIYRPLLPFSREEIRAYAKASGLRPCQDPSNQDQGHARNYLRHRVIPQLEAGPAPRARESLRRLARLARENEEAWHSILPSLLDGILEGEGDGQLVVRSELLVYHPAVQARLWREILRCAGWVLDEAGTRALLEFTRTGASGRAFPLPGGAFVLREFDRFRFGSGATSGGDRPLRLETDEAGQGEAEVGGCRFEVRWGPEALSGMDHRLELLPATLEFPLTVRGWSDGDRIRLPYGSKKLKKLFAEARIPAGDRARIPVLVDAKGRVLWVAGVASSIFITARAVRGSFFLGIRNADTS